MRKHSTKQQANREQNFSKKLAKTNMERQF